MATAAPAALQIETAPAALATQTAPLRRRVRPPLRRLKARSAAASRPPLSLKGPTLFKGRQSLLRDSTLSLRGASLFKGRRSLLRDSTLFKGRHSLLRAASFDRELKGVHSLLRDASLNHCPRRRFLKRGSVSLKGCAPNLLPQKGIFEKGSTFS